MSQRQRPQLGRPQRRKLEQNLTAVVRIGLTFDEACCFQAVYQLDRSVVAQSKAVR